MQKRETESRKGQIPFFTALRVQSYQDGLQAHIFYCIQLLQLHFCCMRKHLHKIKLSLNHSNNSCSRTR